MRLGLLLVTLATLATAGCYRDSDDFNAKAGHYMCRYNAEAQGSPFLDHTTPVTGDTDGTNDPAGPQYEPYGGGSCEADVLDNLDRCSANCDYSPRKARRCLRKLRRAVRRGQFDESTLSVCGRVYTCGEVSDTVLASCKITTENCSVGGRGTPTALLILLAVGGWSRRRRR